MTTTTTVIVNSDRVTAREKNPYPIPDERAFTHLQYWKFNDTVKSYTIIGKFEPGQEVKVREAWQYKTKQETEWTTDFEYQQKGNTFDYFDYNLKMMSNDFETRIAYQPI